MNQLFYEEGYSYVHIVSPAPAIVPDDTQIVAMTLCGLGIDEEEMESVGKFNPHDYPLYGAPGICPYCYEKENKQ